MNGIRPSTGGATAATTVRSPPAKTKVSSSNVSVMCHVSCVMTSTRVIAER